MYMVAILLLEVRKDISVMKMVLRGPARHRLETNMNKKNW